LHKTLKLQAKRNGVPLNTEIVRMLEGHDEAIVKRVVAIAAPLIEEAVKVAAGIGAEVAIESRAKSQMQGDTTWVNRANGWRHQSSLLRASAYPNDKCAI
jgi:hypothetical protein